MQEKVGMHPQGPRAEALRKVIDVLWRVGLSTRDSSIDIRASAYGTYCYAVPKYLPVEIIRT
jgi:hypothetical protein